MDFLIRLKPSKITIMIIIGNNQLVFVITLSSSLGIKTFSQVYFLINPSDSILEAARFVVVKIYASRFFSSVIFTIFLTFPVFFFIVSDLCMITPSLFSEVSIPSVSKNFN